MSNFDNHIIGFFQDDLETVKEFLKIAINTIFFNRWITNNNYICETSEIKDISYMKIEDNSLQTEIGNILYKITNYSKNNQKFQINIEFYSHNQGGLFGFFQKKEVWEKWHILVIVSDKSVKDKETYMRKFITKILNEINIGKDFMPDIKLKEFENIIDGNNKKDNPDNFNFPYTIDIIKEFEQDSVIKIFKDNPFDNDE